ncbi:unnamed protein product [Citrullus colocynthis]|uniref:Uncharacterized protein n=1 Tax=Citrullus colocynthis TaxID=252529 RepID=A0ABP0ZBY3_9ROSI
MIYTILLSRCGSSYPLFCHCFVYHQLPDKCGLDYNVLLSNSSLRFWKQSNPQHDLTLFFSPIVKAFTLCFSFLILSLWIRSPCSTLRKFNITWIKQHLNLNS